MAGSEGVKAGKVGAQGGVMMDRAPEEGLGVKPSAPTSVPLRVRFGEATARTASAQGNTASR